LKPAQVNSSKDPISKKTSQKRVQDGSPEFKLQNCKKIKKNFFKKGRRMESLRTT
jgi:hypothetical protein